MSGWENLFIAEVGASAALAGLIFVGLSINLAKIIAVIGLPGLAFETLALLINILLSSSLMLVPGQPITLIGIEILALGSGVWVVVVAVQRNILRTLKPGDVTRQYYGTRIFLSQIAILPFIASGAAILIWGSGGLYLIVPGILISLLVAVLNAWILLIEINR